MSLPGSPKSTRSSHPALALLTVGGGQLVAQVLTAVALVALGHDDVQALGRVAVYYGIAVAAANIADAGASVRVLRDCAHGPDGIGPSAARAIGLVKPVLVLVVAVLAGVVSGDPALALALGYAGVRGVGLFAQALWNAGGMQRRAAATVVLERAVAVATALGASAIGAPAAIALCGGLVLGALVVVLVALPTVLRASAGARGLRARVVVCYGGRFLGATVAGNLLLLDTTLVALAAGATQAGLYAVGARLLGPMGLLITAAGTALLPGVARGEQSARRALDLVGVVSVAGLAVVFALADWVVPLLAGPSFEAAVPAVRCYIAVTAMVVFAQVLVIRLQACGREGAVSAVLAGMMPFGLAAVFVGALLWPADGAVAGVIGYAVMTAITTGMLFALLVRSPDRGGERERHGDRDVAAGRVAEG